MCRRYNAPVVVSLVLATLVLITLALWMLYIGKPSLTVLAIAFTLLGITMPASQPALFVDACCRGYAPAHFLTAWHAMRAAPQVRAVG